MINLISTCPRSLMEKMEGCGPSECRFDSYRGHISVKVNDVWAASLRSAAKLKGNFQQKFNFWLCCRQSRQ